ncbi:uncharacterized protein LOC143054160 isoform X2 [Mytilus galloprovincialis]|uniref:uncharacterized protein LOC143054160 isoform X2 n=1 Tax=Mytilus galloprovincialis TaxID=29158 RepID=UPI003F7BE627
MDVMCIFICGFLILTTVDRVSTECKTLNLNKEYGIYEDSSLGKLHSAWSTEYDSSWRVIKVNNSFVDVYFINSTDQKELSLIVNVTGSTDLDQVGDCSGLKNASFVLTCGNSISRNFTVVIQAINDHTPNLYNTVGMITELREDFMVLGNVIDFRDRVEDEDCPAQLLKYAVEVQTDADVNGQDGTKYFDIYDNGTLYVKSELDYETTACGLLRNGLLFLDVVIKDVDENPQTTTVPLTMTVIDIDDEPPQFIDMSRDCIRKCKKCSIKSFIGNVSYENKGDVTVNPQMIAEDIEIVNKSVILYYIRGVYPDQFSSLFTIDINNGSLSLLESFRNATNDTIKDDFSVVLYIQAHDMTKMRYTTNVTVDVKIKVKNYETAGKNDDDSTGSNIIMIILPVLAAVIIVITIVLLWWRRQLCFAKSKYDVDEAKETVKETSDDILFTQYAEVNRAKLSADITEEIDQEESENVEDAEYELSVSFDDDDEENQTP